MTIDIRPSPSIQKRLRLVAWFLVVSLGFVQAWSTRYNMEPDGISYLDIADKYIHGDWAGAVNSYWSPLYSWLLGAAIYIVHPSAYWEYPVVHLLNFVIYLFAFVCFEFLLSQLIKFQSQTSDLQQWNGLPSWCWQCISYVLFLWGALFLITVSVVTPDMGVAALVFLLTGLLIRIGLKETKWGLYICFGFVLGVAYLTKAVMFPLGFVFLLALFLWLGKWRIALPRILVASAVFLLVSSPLIFALHRAKNHWTFSDTGKLAYAWFINGIEPSIHWQGDPSGTPVHPTRKVFDSPQVFEFREPFHVTYPPWYDPTYWYEGVNTHFDLKGHARVFGEIVFYFYAIFINSPIGMAVFVSFLVFVLYGKTVFWRGKGQVWLWSILLPAATSFVLYSLVHMETRYVGGFVIIFWLGLFSGIRLSNNSRRIQTAVAIALVTTSLIVLLAKSLVPAFSTFREIVSGGNPPASERWLIAEGLKNLGISPGEPIGSIGYGFGGIEYSARLAKLRIIAEISSGSDFNPKSDVDKFWHSTPEIQAKVIEAFAKTGAKAIVANRLPAGLSDPPGWQRLADTDAYVYFLR